MQSREFYEDLTELPKSFGWEISDDKVITGTRQRGFGKGSTFNPITALATHRLKRMESCTKTGTRRAGAALGLTREFADHVYEATSGANNRGNTQVVRGKIKSALGL